jgi:hypothetical protein
VAPKEGLARRAAESNDLGAYVASGVVGDEVVVRFENGILVQPLDGA